MPWVGGRTSHDLTTTNLRLSTSAISTRINNAGVLSIVAYTHVLKWCDLSGWFCGLLPPPRYWLSLFSIASVVAGLLYITSGLGDEYLFAAVVYLTPALLVSRMYCLADHVALPHLATGNIESHPPFVSFAHTVHVRRMRWSPFFYFAK